VDYTCRQCGRSGNPYGHGRCAYCVLADRVTGLLTGPDGAISPELQPLAAAFARVHQPFTAIQWIRQSPNARLLARLVADGRPVSHELLDELPPASGLHSIRQVLVQTGVLPQRHEDLERVPSWLEHHLDGKPASHASLVRPFLHWHLLRRARSRASARRYPASAGRDLRRRVLIALELLAWLDEQGTGLAGLRQDHLDRWLDEEDTQRRNRIRYFLTWTAERGLTRKLTVPLIPRQQPADLLSVQALRGMFAFSLWDSRARTLLLARDRMGEKPLYLCHGPRMLTFASELGALAASGSVRLALDPTAVHEYFHYQYVPEPSTPLQDVSKLPPGHLVVVHVHPWHIEYRRYWSMLDARALDGDPVEALEAELQSFGPLVTRADVPLGVALSGGLDSSTVAALAARASTQPVHAFSLGYRGRPGNDERSQAHYLATVLGMEFHEIELATDDVVNAFPALVRDWDDPIADMAGFSYQMIARLARRHGVRVLLQEQGGDELYWGYPWVRRAVTDPSALNNDRLSGSRPLIFYDLDPDFQEAQRRYKWLYENDFRRTVDEFAPLRRFILPVSRNELSVQITRLISETYLLENGIAQGDRLTMASSVELRLPLVDHLLVETTIGFRRTHEDYRLGPKAWLRRAVAGLLPDNVQGRQKRPFSPPLIHWHAALMSAYRWMLPGGALVELGVLRAEVAKKLSVEPFPEHGGSPLSFKALVLEAWCRTRLGVGEPVENRCARHGNSAATHAFTTFKKNRTKGR
jgi:asparagine synthase (glutamine-hydrolysing)